MSASGRPSGPPARRIRPFTPSQEPASTLSERTVGRDSVLGLLSRRFLTAASSENRPHSLLIGPRGAGKTHLVDVALHRASRDPAIAGRLVFVRLDEDAVGITRYRDILAEVLRALEGSGIGQRLAITSTPEADVAEKLGRRVLVLVIENLDRVFSSIGVAGQRDMRSWVESSGQVLIFATSPLLFPGVQDRNLPWYGSFGISYLEDLSLDQGRQLLVHLARHSGDESLAAFLASNKGLARLEAINALAGGSPRIWMILSECLTVELLDELVPAVEALLEGLVPYYQQLLWDLAGNEQRLVRELATGPHQAATVAELAASCDLEQRTAATTLGRLKDLRWVRREQAPGLDQRSTWYRLREPMLRHHFQYRASAGQPLTLIVELLRAWFDPSQLRDQLGAASAASETERLMAASLSSEPSRFDTAYVDRDCDELLIEARRWLSGTNALSRTTDSGSLIDIMVTAARKGAEAALETTGRRELSHDALRVANLLIERARDLDRTLPDGERVSDLLRLAADSVTGRTHVVLELVSAGWDGERWPSTARDRLAHLVNSFEGDDPDDPLLLDVEQEFAFWTGESGEPAAARDRFAVLVPRCERILGPNHRDTLIGRINLARWTGRSGDPLGARDRFAALVPRCEEVLGREHRDTLMARFHFARWTGAAGDAEGARDQLAVLVPIQEAVIGSSHRHTLSARNNLAYWAGVAGDAVGARDQFGALVAILGETLGPVHRRTLIGRLNLAYWTGAAGDVAAARDEAAELIPIQEQVFGSAHKATLSTRYNLARWTGEAGNAAVACDLAATLLTDLPPQEADDEMAGAIRLVLQKNIRRLLSTDQGWPHLIPVDVSDLGLAATLRAAVGGSAEALVRLPSEFVEIVDSLRTTLLANEAAPALVRPPPG